MASAVPVEKHIGESRVTGDSFIRPHLRKQWPYQSVLPFEIVSARLGRKPEGIIKLDANESPYGPPPEDDLAKMGVMIRHHDKEELRRYVMVTVGSPEHKDAQMHCLKQLE